MNLLELPCLSDGGSEGRPPLGAVPVVGIVRGFLFLLGQVWGAPPAPEPPSFRREDGRSYSACVSA